MLLLEGRRNSVEIARTLLDGADALLLEPYSVESLHTISRLAEKMKKERSRMRMQVPLRLLVREIAAQLGQVARLEKSGASGLVSRGVLQEMCSVLGELDQETLSLYFEVILEVFPELPATHCSVHVRTYRGISQCVRNNYSVRDPGRQGGVGGIASSDEGRNPTRDRKILVLDGGSGDPISRPPILYRQNAAPRCQP